MTRLQMNTLRTTGAFVAISGLFLFGFAKITGSNDPLMIPKIGLAAGWMSAMCWGLSVVDESPLPNRWFNFVAAVFAAMSLGYLAPPETTFAGLMSALHIGR